MDDSQTSAIHCMNWRRAVPRRVLMIKVGGVKIEKELWQYYLELGNIWYLPRYSVGRYILDRYIVGRYSVDGYFGGKFSIGRNCPLQPALRQALHIVGLLKASSESTNLSQSLTFKGHKES